MRRAFAVLVPCVVLTAALLTPAAAAAYVGPGSVISGVGALLAVTVAVVASVFGFLWYPMKKVIRRLRRAEPEGTAAGDAATGEVP